MKRDIPEVLQTSAMDCGPAALAALLQGCDIPASYGRLREVCQTSVDGTSLDTLEQVAQKLGLDARQILLPREVVLEPQNLPALLVVQKEDQGLHFVVAWRRSGQQVQVMDPSRGRVWLSVGSLLRKIYVHVQPMPAPAWRRWAAGPTGLELLCGWMEGLGFTETQQEEQVVAALADPGWEGFAALFASLRLLRLLKEEGALKEGPSLLARLLPLGDDEETDHPRRRHVCSDAGGGIGLHAARGRTAAGARCACAVLLLRTREMQGVLADGDEVVVRDLCLGHAHAINQRAVRRVHVDDEVLAVLLLDARVVSGD
ncbi:MAG TPA: cysteine peptidase family C39 domain-containing protein, partial [Myxococcota bacterium]|nr:cysteine peptidase family C39 domain-containing protein [Myxococcota bacterium]